MSNRFRIASPPRRPAHGPRQPESVRARLPGRYDLEEFSYELQRLVARLSEMDVRGIERCSLYFTPLDGSGGRCVVFDLTGKPTTLLDI